jgi:hypothetical protein
MSIILADRKGRLRALTSFERSSASKEAGDRKGGVFSAFPYYYNPLPGVVYWELDLREERTVQQSTAVDADEPRR